jgi:uncharacterized membrane protein
MSAGSDGTVNLSQRRRTPPGRAHGYAPGMSNWNASWTRNIWRPEEPRLFVRRTDGFGWSVNFAHLLRRTRRPT